MHYMYVRRCQKKASAPLGLLQTVVNLVPMENQKVSQLLKHRSNSNTTVLGRKDVCHGTPLPFWLSCSVILYN